MKQILLGLMIVTLSLLGCGENATSKVTPTGYQEINLEPFYNATKVKGSFILKGIYKGDFKVYNPIKAAEGFIPASTFKIPHGLIALETGVITDRYQKIKWDGVKRDISAWNMDHTFMSAINLSCVPCFQQIAREVGYTRMESNLDKIPFGDMKVTKNTLDDFWLVGDSRITPFEQLEFMEAFAKETLPFSKENYAIVKEAMKVQDNDKYAMFGKTGHGIMNNKQVGWFVGFVEQNAEIYVFVTQIEVDGVMDGQAFRDARKAITFEALRQEGLL